MQHMRRAQCTTLQQVLRNLGSAAVGERLTYQIKISITREELGGVSPLRDPTCRTQPHMLHCNRDVLVGDFTSFFRHLQVNHLNCFPFPCVSVSSLRKTPQVLCNVVCSLRYQRGIRERRPSLVNTSTRFCFVSSCHDASSSFLLTFSKQDTNSIAVVFISKLFQ